MIMVNFGCCICGEGTRGVQYIIHFSWCCDDVIVILVQEIIFVNVGEVVKIAWWMCILMMIPKYLRGKGWNVLGLHDKALVAGAL